MTEKELREIRKIKGQYEIKNVEKSDLEKLKELDKAVKRPAEINSYARGTGASLIMGTGMTMAMALIPGGMLAGVAIGSVGLLAMATNHILHKKHLNARKKKYSNEILSLSNSLLSKQS